MQSIIDKAYKLGIDKVAHIKTKDIIFSAELRAACEQNTCRNYGTNWMCPPGIGEANKCIENAKTFKNGILLQYFVRMKSPFDYEAMIQGGKDLREILAELKKELYATYTSNYLVLGAGSCQKCNECAYTLNEACRFPDEAFSSVEAHGIYVSDIMKKAGLSYKDGDNSISFVGMILF